MSSKELAIQIIKNLKYYKDEQDSLNMQFGDSRGAEYRGSMQDDLLKLAQQVLKEFKG